MENEKIPRPPSTEIPPPPLPKQEKVVIRETQTLYLDGNIPFQPPQAVELEEIVLGSFLIDTRSTEYIHILEPEVFFKNSHANIFEAMKKIHSEGIGIDLVTVSEELRRTSRLDMVGGDYYLVNLTQKVSSAAHLEFHIRILAQKYVLRELIKVSHKTMSGSLKDDPDIFDMMDYVETELARIGSVALRRAGSSAELTPKEEIKERVRKKREGIAIGVPSGIEEFDQWSDGFKPRELWTIAGRPGMGKTASVIAMIIYAVFTKGIKIVFFSLEMSYNDLVNRLVSAMTGIEFDIISKGLATDAQLEHIDAAIDKIEESSLVILDTRHHKNLAEKIFVDMRKYAGQGYEEFIIDYVQLMKLARSKGDRNADISTITGDLKAAANELNVPVIQLAQLSREVDKRKGHRPGLSDLRESGSIEQDSDGVIFIVRPEYYRKKDEGITGSSSVPLPPGAQDPAGELHWMVEKGRSTGTKDFVTYLDLKTFTFESYSGIAF